MQRRVYPDIESLSQGFAEFAAAALRDTLSRKPQATLVVPGGAGAAPAWAPHAQRARGIGSRFRSLPQTSLARGLS